jgi:hypothetical protein
MALEEFAASEITVGHGETMNLIGYDGNTYIKITSEAGSPSTYQFMGTGGNITLSGTLERVQRHSQHFVLHPDVFITDNLGNTYSLLFKPTYEVLVKDGNDIPTVVGRAPRGKFGG